LKLSKDKKNNGLGCIISAGLGRMIGRSQKSNIEGLDHTTTEKMLRKRNVEV
jgi:hypothetical protein